MMFLDCPAHLDQYGALRCGLPAEVRCRFIMRSTDGPLEAVMIMCPAGHWFNAPISALTCDNRHPHGPASPASTPGAARAGRTASPDPPDCDRRPIDRVAPAEPGWAYPRPATAPPYYLGRPAQFWITALTPRRRRAAPLPPREPSPARGNERDRGAESRPLAPRPNAYS